MVTKAPQNFQGGDSNRKIITVILSLAESGSNRNQNHNNSGENLVDIHMLRYYF